MVAARSCSGIALLVSIFDLIPLPLDASWGAIILCDLPNVPEAVIGGVIFAAMLVLTMLAIKG